MKTWKNYIMYHWFKYQCLFIIYYVSYSKIIEYLLIILWWFVQKQIDFDESLYLTDVPSEKSTIYSALFMDGRNKSADNGLNHENDTNNNQFEEDDEIQNLLRRLQNMREAQNLDLPRANDNFLNQLRDFNHNKIITINFVVIN